MPALNQNMPASNPAAHSGLCHGEGMLRGGDVKRREDCLPGKPAAFSPWLSCLHRSAETGDTRDATLLSGNTTGSLRT